MEPTSLSLPPLSGPPVAGEVITFYSYKGGTGRTMALSHLARLLARRQNATAPVLMIDWDLEAPALHRHFGLQQQDSPGVLEFFEACREQLLRRRNGAPAPDEAALAHEVLSAVGWERYVTRVDHASQLYLMRAGRFDDSYPDRLAAMQWDALFYSCPALYRCFADRLTRHFSHVLIDSRNGRTDSAGVCTTLLPRKLVLVFTPGRNGMDGLPELVSRATHYRRSHEDEQRPLLIYPLPSRVDIGDGGARAQWRRGDAAQQVAGYQPAFEELLRQSYGLQQMSLESYFDEVQLQPATGRADRENDRFSLTRTLETFLAWLVPGHFPWQSSGEIQLLEGIDEARRVMEAGGGAARTVWQPLARDLKLLGELYRSEGKLRPAQLSFEESLALRQRGLGEDHPDTLASKSNLADVLRQQGRLDEAQFLDECIVEARQRILGNDHPDTVAAQVSLAATLSCQGRPAEALTVQDNVVDTCLRLLGPDHLQTLAARADRAALLRQRGELQLARVVQEQVLAARARLLGDEHADTLRSKTALATTLLQMQDLDTACRLLDAVLQAHLRELGPDHPHTRQALAQLTDVQARTGVPADDAALAPELHQDAAMDDYGDALVRPLRRRGTAPARPARAHTSDELVAVEEPLYGSRTPQR